MISDASDLIVRELLVVLMMAKSKYGICKQHLTQENQYYLFVLKL